MKRTMIHRLVKPPKVGRRAARPAAKPADSQESNPAVRTLADQKIDFTAEGAPPPGQVASAEHGTVPPALPNDTQAPSAVADATVGAVESKPMKQAFRDVARGLQDTDRGAEAGRTYQKLKSAVRPAARRKSGK